MEWGCKLAAIRACWGPKLRATKLPWGSPGSSGTALGLSPVPATRGPAEQESKPLVAHPARSEVSVSTAHLSSFPLYVGLYRFSYLYYFSATGQLPRQHLLMADKKKKCNSAVRRLLLFICFPLSQLDSGDIFVSSSFQAWEWPQFSPFGQIDMETALSCCTREDAAMLAPRAFVV